MFHLKKLNNKILPLTMNNMTGTFKEPLLYDSYIGQYRNLKAEWIFKMSVLIVIESTDLEYDFINYSIFFLFLYFVHAAAHLWKKNPTSRTWYFLPMGGVFKISIAISGKINCNGAFKMMKL